MDSDTSKVQKEGTDPQTGHEWNRREFLTVGGLAGAAVGMGFGLGSVLGACGGSTSPAASVGASAGAAAGESAIGSLPTEMQGWYEGADKQPHGPSPLLNFKAKNPPPWLIGYASPYAGNSWKEGVRTRIFNDLLPKYKSAGLVKDVIITESNLNNTLQIQQIKQLVDQGCDGIFSSSGDSTALNGAIGYAYDHGVPFVMLSAFVTYPGAISVSVNNWASGKLQAEALAKKMGEKGKVLEVAGILGSAANLMTADGVRKGLEAYPDIKIVGTVEGKWTEPVAQTGVLNWLSTHPEDVQGVATQSPGELGTLQAYMQSGRKIPPFTLGGVLGPAVYWEKNPDWVDLGYNVWPPGDEGQAGFEALIRILQGQGPLIQSILYPPSTYKHSDLSTVVPSDATVASDGWVSPPYGTSFPYTADIMNNYWTNGTDPLAWKPS